MDKMNVIGFDQVPDLISKPEDIDKFIKIAGPTMINLNQLQQIGFSIPNRFCITANAYYKFVLAGNDIPDDLWNDILSSIHNLEVKTGKQFGGEHPLFLSCNSVAPDQGVLNIGMNDYTARMLSKELEQNGIVYDGYRRLIRGYGINVLQIPETEFDDLLIQYRVSRNIRDLTQMKALDWIQITKLYKGVIVRHSHQPFPQDPLVQLRQIIRSAFTNFYSKDFVVYRGFTHSSPDLKPTILIAEMNYGTSAVFSTHQLNTGEQIPEGIFAPSCYLDDLLNENLPFKPISELPEWSNVESLIPSILKTFHQPVTVQFIVTNGKIEIISVYTSSFSSLSRFRAISEIVESGIATREEVIKQFVPAHFNCLLRPKVESKPKTPLCVGTGGAYGSAVGILCCDPNECIALKHQGKNPILVKQTLLTSDITAVQAAIAVVTIEGGNYSWIADTCRQMSKTAAIGCKNLIIDSEKRTIDCNGISCNFGDTITVDLGDVYPTALQVQPVTEIQSEYAINILQWCDKGREVKLNIYSKTDSVEQTKLSSASGADGIGILSMDAVVHQSGACESLVTYVLNGGSDPNQILGSTNTTEEYQDENDNSNMMELQSRLESGCIDFLLASGNQNVDISLISNPLSSFLPTLEEIVVQIAELETKEEISGISPQIEEKLSSKYNQLEMVNRIKENNPLFGLKGIRMNLAIPGLFTLQIVAIIKALQDAKTKGVNPNIRIILPGVSDAKEINLLENEFQVICQEKEVDLTLGVTFESPKSCYVSDKIAEKSSFGILDSDALITRIWAIEENCSNFLSSYFEWGLLELNPFDQLDINGMGKILKKAANKLNGKEGYSLGVSVGKLLDQTFVRFCYELGINSLIVEPNLVPVARMCASQAILSGNSE